MPTKMPLSISKIRELSQNTMICDKLSKKKLIGSIIALTIIAHIIIHLTLS